MIFKLALILYYERLSQRQLNSGAGEFSLLDRTYRILNMKKGKLIVVEGTDGSGKTVQTGLLTERLSKEGYQVQMTDFPQYGKSFFANMIEKYLKGKYGWPQELRYHLKKYPLPSSTGRLISKMCHMVMAIIGKMQIIIIYIW